MKTPRLLLAIVSATALISAYVLWSIANADRLLIQGEVEATRIDLAPRVSGRVAQVNVDFGDTTRKGQVLVQLESPQLEAKLLLDKAALEVAEANRTQVFSTRIEVITARKAELSRFDSDLDLAQKRYKRIKKLHATALTSAEDLDEASNQVDAALRAQEAAAANLLLAQNGSSDEQKAISEAQVQQAQAKVSETKTNIEELAIKSPIDGQVTARMAEPGKNFSAGAPLLAIVDLENLWFTFNIREDLLSGIKVGDDITVIIPALGDRKLVSTITAINVLGSYANWRATKATGDFDLRTFSIRAVPTERPAELRPGMSALVEL